MFGLAQNNIGPNNTKGQIKWEWIYEIVNSKYQLKNFEGFLP